MTRFYLAVLEPSAGGFSVFSPDVPGCASSGATLSEAALNAEEALHRHLELDTGSGEPIPDARDDLDVRIDPYVEVAGYTLVNVDLPVLMKAA